MIDTMPALNSNTPTSNSVQWENPFRNLLINHWRNITFIWLGATIVGYGLSFALPPMYTASTRVLPPQAQHNSLSSMLNQLPIMGGASGGALGKDPALLYIGLLNSTTIANRLIELFNLESHYKQKTLTDTRSTLEHRSVFKAGKDTIISIDVTDEDPNRAASIANAYSNELNRLLQSLAISEAAQRRKFFEAQLLQNKQELTQAEIHFKELQEHSGVLQLEAQGRIAIETISKLRAMIAAKEIEIKALRVSATNENSEVKRLQAELDGLQIQLIQLEKNADSKDINRLNIGVDTLPTKGMEYVRRYRDLKFQETMYELMIKQYEMAKLDESRTSQTIQVIDPATPPEKRSSPKRALVAIIVGLVAMLISCVILFFMPFLKNSLPAQQ